MDAEIMGALTQFGVAGLVCWMWLVERRASAERERQMTEAHRALMQQREEREGLIEVVRSNTRALTAMEVGQRELIGAIERLGHGGSERRAS
ncbi:MAG: hypothetical protein ACF8MF_11770 [Phycisphaerales bacterium JB052]